MCPFTGQECSSSCKFHDYVSGCLILKFIKQQTNS
jgi:hypothetical protein